MTSRLYCLILVTTLFTSCALAQQGTLRSERVIITNLDTSVYPPNDFQIRNSSLGSRVQIGINASDRAVSSYFNENDNLALELDTTEGVAMFRILADSPNANKITGGISTGGTALDTGYFQILGEDRASGLDAYTVINGGDIDTNTILVRTTNASPGYVQWDDTTGTGSLVSLFGYNGGSAASYSLYWPAASYATSSCGGTCVIEIDDSTGQMSFAAPSGGGGGGSPGGATDEIQLNDGAGGFDTVTGFKHDGTTLTIVGDTAISADSTYNFGSATTRFLSFFGDDVTTEELFFRRQGAGSQDFLFQNTTSNILDIKNSAGTTIWRYDESGSGSLQAYRQLVPGTTANLDLGTSSLIWDDLHVDSVHAYTEVLPDTDGGATLGSSSLRFSEANILNTVYIGDAAATTGDIVLFNSTAASNADIYTLDLGIGAGPEVTLNTSFVPDTNNSYHLGYSSNRWAKAWVVDLDISGTCTGCPSGSGSPAGSSDEVQINSGGSFGVVSGFAHDGDALTLPASASSPSSLGGRLVLTGDTTNNFDLVIDAESGGSRIFMTAASDRTLTIFNSGAAALNVVLEGDLTPLTDSVYTIGTPGATDSRWLSGAFDDLTTEDLFFRRQGTSSQDFSLQNQSSGILRLFDSSANEMVELNATGGAGAQYIEFTSDIRASATNTVDIGTSSTPINYLYSDGATLGRSGETGSLSFTYTSGGGMTITPTASGVGQINANWNPSIDATFDVGAHTVHWYAIRGEYLIGYTAVMPDADGGGDLGTSSAGFQTLYMNSQVVFDGSPSGTATLTSATYSSGEAIEASALAISGSGSFYARNYSGSSVSCGSVTDGWLGVRTDSGGASGGPQIEVCIGGAMKYVGLN